MASVLEQKDYTNGFRHAGNARRMAAKTELTAVLGGAAAMLAGLIRKWAATDASPHESQKLNDILDTSNTASQVWADSAYRGRDRGQAR